MTVYGGRGIDNPEEALNDRAVFKRLYEEPLRTFIEYVIVIDYVVMVVHRPYRVRKHGARGITADDVTRPGGRRLIVSNTGRRQRSSCL